MKLLVGSIYKKNALASTFSKHCYCITSLQPHRQTSHACLEQPLMDFQLKLEQ